MIHFIVRTEDNLSKMISASLLKTLRNSQKPVRCLAYSSSNFVCKDEPYTVKQDKLGRHVAPHVEIYKFPPAALSSITNRITGVALSAGEEYIFFLIQGPVIITSVFVTGITGIAAVSLVGADAAHIMTCIGDSPVGVVARFAVAFPFVFHYMGGIRHIAWDNNPDMLTTDQVEKSSYVVIGAAVAVSTGLALVTI